MSSHIAAPRAPGAAAVPEELGGSYRAFLDGLRAVAVYLVVLFHAGSDRFSGGFVGVDVFFVLSGYLVTQLLLRDLRGQGSISFGRFYARRFRRLLPAAFATLVITALVFSALASPIEVADAEGGFRAAFLYVANWHFVAQSSDYFGADLSANPVLHFWSLAVEEQFYLLWPLLLGGLFVLARRFGAGQWNVMRLVVVAGALASVLWAWSLRMSDPNRAYYGTDTRAYQLLAGAALALTPGLIARLRPARRWAGGAAIAAVGALVLVASSWVRLDAIERGIVVTAITVALIVALETARGGLIHQGLSLPPIVYLGQISYGTYLWHWPVIVVLARSFDLAPISTIAVTVLVATALASLSYQLMERPIRLSAGLDRWRLPVIGAGLAISLGAGLLIIPTITDRATAPAAAVGNGTALATTGFTPVPDLDWTAIAKQRSIPADCSGKPATACTIRRGAGAHLLVIGDSHAAMMIDALAPVARQHDLTLSLASYGGCPWQQDLYATPVAAVGLRVADCRRVKDDVYDRVIPALDPDIIVTMNVGYERLRRPVSYLGPDERGHRDGSLDWVRQTTTAAIQRLEEDGRKIVLLEPIPVIPAKFVPLDCLATARVVQECRFVADPSPSFVEQTYQQIDRADDQVWSLDLDEVVCPFLPICDPIVDGTVVMVDGNHLTRDFAASLAPVIERFLTANGVLP